MAGHSAFECNVCGYTIRTNGPWEFYIDGSGQRKIYGHPPYSPMMMRKTIMRMRDKAWRRKLLDSFEADLKKRPSLTVNGFLENAYCRECDEVKDVVVFELEHPVDVHIAWQEIAGRGYRLALRNWFKARPAGLRNICRWMFAMPSPRDRWAARNWDRRRRDSICPVCGNELLMGISELPCPRCKEGVFHQTVSAQS